jgi:hypothetical protein
MHAANLILPSWTISCIILRSLFRIGDASPQGKKQIGASVVLSEEMTCRVLLMVI